MAKLPAMAPAVSFAGEIRLRKAYPLDLPEEERNC